MSLVVDVSVFIDRLFIYDENRSNRAQNLFKLIDEKGLSIFEPQYLWDFPKTWRVMGKLKVLYSREVAGSGGIIAVL